jgi:hypothetical protein
MLAAEMASTTAKPSMILARNRKVGSFGDIDCEPTQDLQLLFSRISASGSAYFPNPCR